MKDETFDANKILAPEDFTVDSLGRIIIENPELLNAINGAMQTPAMDDWLLNGGCSNSGCG